MNLRETIKRVLKEDMDEKKHRVLETIIRKMILDNSIYQEIYPNLDDPRNVEYIITYSLDGLNIVEDKDEQIYYIEIVLSIHEILANGWIKSYDTDTNGNFVPIDDYYDIPEYVWEDIEEGINNRVIKVLPDVYLSFDWVNKIGK